jgi:Fe-S cluster biogenesis protein NfuA
VESRSRQVSSKTDPQVSADETGRYEAAAEDDELRASLLKVCREVLAPLVAADGGVMYLVKATADEAHFHLTGTCAGCPGAALTRDGVIAPAVRSVLPKARVIVTTGYRVPEGATKVAAD